MDAAGNILYSDPTSPQVFTIISSNGQFSGTITYPSREPYLPHLVFALPQGCLSKDAIMTCSADEAASHPCCHAACLLDIQICSLCTLKIAWGQQHLNVWSRAAAPPPPSTMAAISTAAAKLLSKGAIAGIVIGVFFGMLIVVIMMTVTFAILRRRAALPVRMQPLDCINHRMIACV